MSETRRPLELNTSRGRMKRLMEVAARHAETIYHSASMGIWVGGETCVDSGNNSRFWSLVLEVLSTLSLRKEEADRTERQVQEIAGWSNPMEEKIGFVEAVCLNYEVLVEDKLARLQYETWSGSRKSDGGQVGSQEKAKFSSFRLNSEIEWPMNLWKVLEDESSTIGWNSCYKKY